ncbi:MAG: SH3 domain-containing protein, partial [Clostridia bacterium]|nr:SH3 domain-containing protein [Clostridia bacterium]
MKRGKQIRKVFSFLLICILLLSMAVTPSSAATVYGKITGDSVRVRSAANTTTSTVLGSLTKGTVVTINSTVTGTEAEAGKGKTWYKITSGTLTGYVYGAYVSEVKDEVPATNLAFEKQLAAFPASYQSALKTLHATYPNWIFIADPVNNTKYKTFDELVAAECVNHYKCVSKSDSNYNCKSYFSMDNGWYDWSKGTYTQNPTGWVGASREVIAYYMDPRNFLNNSDIYMFAQLSYDSSTQTKEGLKLIVKGTYLEKTFSDPKDSYNNYVDIIMEAAKRSGVSPYALASTLIQEQGSKGTSSLISGTYAGYEGYYNFFNCGASGTSVVINGLKYAKSHGWDTRSASIFGGAEILGGSYIGGGQDTYYYKDFDVKMASGYFKQYAQSVYDA